MTDKKYDAFISYRHTELDKFVAINLHKKLESFKLPKGVTSSTGKKKIERVFRDQDELPLSSDLSAQINDALIVSDFLIVICTPRLPESEWCKREIETFIKLHGRDKILAVLAEGEPWESFPEALTKEPVEITKPDGTKEIELRSVEPLAADVRGKNNKEIKKKLDDAVLRIAAAIFNLGYDDLKQRHKERKMKRTLSAISGIAAGLLLFSAVCLAMTFKIMVQSEIILDQNKDIVEQNNRITLLAQELEFKNQDLSAQYKETHINYAKATANNADSLMHKGRRLDALYALRRVMPSSVEDDEVPYTAETQFALTNALEVYYDDSSLSTGKIYETDSNIIKFDVSPDNKYLLVIDTTYILKIFDIASGEIIHTAHVDVPLFGTERNIAGFLDSQTVIYNTSEGLISYDIAKNSPVSVYIPATNDVLSANVVPFKQSNLFFAYDSSTIYVYKSDDLSSLYSYKFSELPNQTKDILTNLDYIGITPNSEYLLFTVENYDGLPILYRIRMDDGDVTDLNVLDFGGADPMFSQVAAIYLTNDAYYISDMVTSSDFLDAIYSISSYDMITGKKNWSTEVDSYAKKMYKNSDGTNLFVGAGNYFLILDSITGEKTYSYADSADILYLQRGSFNGDTADYITTDSCIKSYMGAMGVWKFGLFATVPDMEICDLAITKDGALMQFKDNNYITGYYYKKASDSEDNSDEVTRLSEDCKEISRSGDLYLANTNFSNETQIYKTSTNEIAYTYTSSNRDFSFVDDGSSCLVAFGNGFEVYDFVSKKPVCAAPGTYSFASSCVSCDKKYILGSGENNSYTVFSLLTGEEVSTFSVDEDILPSNVILINKDTYATVEYGEKLKIYKVGDTSPCFTSTTAISREDSIFTCDYKDMLCISYENCSFEVYSAGDTVELVQSFYAMDIQYLSDSTMIYYPDKDIYVLSNIDSEGTYIMNSDCEPIAYLPRAAYYIESENKFICYGYAYNYTTPFYTYEELIKMADETLGDYQPSQRITAQFNIK